MAAAIIIPAVATALQAAIPLIPGAIVAIENLIKGKGADKKQAAVDLVKEGLTALANMGVLPSAGVVDPSFPAELGKLVQTSFDKIAVKNPDGWTVPVLPGIAAAAVSAAKQLAATVVSGAGRTFLMVEV